MNIKIRKATCYVTATVERKRESDEKHKRKMKPGEYYYPVIETIDGNPLPTRLDFYKSLSEIA